MVARIANLPFFVILMGIGAFAMYLPAAHAAVVGDFAVMRAFFNSGNLFMVLSAFVAIAVSSQTGRNPGRSQLLSLLSAFLVLPLMLAVPVVFSVPDTSFLNAYVEMVSDITTTGATLFDDPARLPGAVHLWRGLVGWLGGFLMLVAAAAILAPMNLGGFEVLSPVNAGRETGGAGDAMRAADRPQRLQHWAAHLFPIYAGLTAILWVALLVMGDRPLVAIVHSMSVLATSGISPVGGLQGSGAGVAGEAVIFLFLIVAISRQTISPDQSGNNLTRLAGDPEFRIGLACVIVIPLALFLRHWAGAFEVDRVTGLGEGARALWGSIFTVMSFLTTTGFESSAWDSARGWSGLQTPGMILMGLALVGGGVATTAGGVKLLRVYALYKHGVREMDRLVHPSSVGGAGSVARRLRRQGAQVAWIFFMLFALSLALTVVAFALTGQTFEASVTLAVAALSTTGPLLSLAAETPISVAALPDTAKYILSGAMVLGRLEMLAMIALLNPEFWRS
ncbi:MAG: TrkH family potassium uptake protein [Paracoccaceae bacterium]